MDVSVFFVYFAAVNQGVINSCRFLKKGPLCGPLTFDRSPNMVRRSACRSASFFLHRKDRLWCAAEFKNARTEAGMITRKSLD